MMQLLELHWHVFIFQKFTSKDDDVEAGKTKRFGEDYHMLRFARSPDDHLLRFARARNDDHMLRFARSNQDHMLRFARDPQDDMLRYIKSLQEYFRCWLSLFY